jgi:hypothetical protein
MSTTATILRSIELAKRNDVDSWELADAIYADVLSLVNDGAVAPPIESDISRGLYAAQDEIADLHRKARSACQDRIAGA